MSNVNWKSTEKAALKSKSHEFLYAFKDDSKIVNKKEISNTANNFFCTIGEELASNIDTAPNPLLSGGFTNRSSSIKFKCMPIGVQDIRDVIAKIKTS